MVVILISRFLKIERTQIVVVMGFLRSTLGDYSLPYIHSSISRKSADRQKIDLCTDCRAMSRDVWSANLISIIPRIAVSALILTFVCACWVGIVQVGKVELRTGPKPRAIAASITTATPTVGRAFRRGKRENGITETRSNFNGFPS